MPLHLTVLTTALAVCKFKPTDPIPASVFTLPFWSLTHTSEELSLIVPSEAVHPGWNAEPGWQAFKIDGQLDFSLVGILAAIASPLAQARVSIFTISTYNTDYFLVKAAQMDTAILTLRKAGFEVGSPD
jgi:uncharacterized protein